MNTICIITLGTSDVQISKRKLSATGEFLVSDGCLTHKRTGVKVRIKPNRGSDDMYLLDSPRNDGKIAAEHYPEFHDVLEIPLIMPIIGDRLAEGATIIHFILVVTNQPETIHHSRYDSLYYADIFKSHLCCQDLQFSNAKFDTCEIKENLTDTDFQYIRFNRELKRLIECFDSKENDIYLIPQGGIDQVNQSLTLQLIYEFRDSVKIFQKAENAPVKRLEFVSLFLKDQAKKQVESLIHSLEYDAATKIVSSFSGKKYRKLASLLRFAHLRKNFLYREADKVINELGNSCPEEIISYISREVPESDINVLLGPGTFFIIEKFSLSEYYFSIDNYTDFILSFQIFLETLVGQFLSMNENIDLAGKNYYTNGNNLIQSIEKKEPDLYSELLAMLNLKGHGQLKLSFPVLAAIAIKRAMEHLDSDVIAILNPLLEINGMLNGSSGSCGIDTLRNRIAHDGEGVLKNDIINASRKKPADRNSLSTWNGYFTLYKEKFWLKKNCYERTNKLILDWF